MGPYSYTVLIRGKTLLFSFYEAFFRLRSQILGTAFTNGSSYSAQVQANSTDCVVVTRDNEVNTVRIGVGINDSEYRDTQGVSFFDCDVLVVCIDYEQRVWQAAHIFDTAQAVFQLVQFTSTHQRFFLSQLIESTVLRLGFQIFQALDGLTNSLPPHAGAAPGIDRMIMLLLEESNIREVIAFPKNSKARDLLMRAPSVVNKSQLDDVHIRIKEEDLKKDE